MRPVVCRFGIIVATGYPVKIIDWFHRPMYNPVCIRGCHVGVYVHGVHAHDMLQVLPIANQVRDRHHFTAGNGVLITACTLVTAIYVSVGFFAYVSTRDFESTLSYSPLAN